MDYLWIGLLGLVMGALAGQVFRGHYHIVADMILGVLGALAGGHLFITYLSAWASPKVGGLLFGAIGAGLVLLAWRSMRSVN